VKFKIDENLPVELVDLLHLAGHEASSVVAQQIHGKPDPVIMEVCIREAYILVTLDLGFANIRAYPPGLTPGILVLRPGRQDKGRLLRMFERSLPVIDLEPVEGRLWIIEEARVRIRGGD
jgi:predicted nuclease of predicted toxin-antitoxin system